MRHLKGYRKLNRTSSHRKAMFRNMVTSLFKYGQITTTDVKAKELRRIAEKVITLSKRVLPETLVAASAEEQKLLVARRVHLRRQAALWVNERDVLHHLFEVIGPRFAKRQGGYTRILKLSFRPGDNAAMSLIQLVEGEDAPVAAPAPEATTPSDATPAA